MIKLIFDWVEIVQLASLNQYRLTMKTLPIHLLYVTIALFFPTFPCWAESKIAVQNIHHQLTIDADKVVFSPLNKKQYVALQLLNNQQNKTYMPMNWQQSTQVKVPGGIEVFKFQNHYQSIPIMGDWAMVIFNPTGSPTKLEYTASAIKFNNQNNHKTWPPESAELWSEILKPLKQANSINKIWYKNEGFLTPAYTIHHIENINQQPNQMVSIVSARSGKHLAKSSLTHELSFDYKVYTLPNGTPADSVFGSTQPHPTGMPDNIQPSVFADQTMVTLETTAASGDPWLDDAATSTIGNHVDVFFNSLLLPDGTYDNLFSVGGAWGPEFQPEDGDFRAQATSLRTFDYTYEPSLSADDFFQLFGDPMPSNPSTTDPQINAKLVQAFYMANTMHDFFYDAGFTELAGNAQHDNYARGGIENDRMIIHGNCVSTFVFTPEDGIQPVMCLGRNSSSSSNKDASFDYSIFAHEWTHYMYKRLVQGPTLPSGNQGRSLNEGWADLVGMFMTVDEADVSTPNSSGINRPYTVGGYFNTDYDRSSFFDPMGTKPDAHFYGIRRWPIGASNPFTFKHIEHAQELPLNYAYFDWKGRSKFNSTVHTAGEIWAATVWDCFRAVFADRSDRTFDQNRSAIASYIVGGMAATPPDPTFLEARNGVLFAIQNMDQSDWQTCRQTFAARGMGSGAIAPDRLSKTHLNVIESFADADLHLSVIHNSLSDDLVSFDDDGILDHLESGHLSLTLKNTGFDTIEIAAVELISDADFQFDPAPFEIFNLPPGAEIEWQAPIKLLHDRQYSNITITVVVGLSGNNGNSGGGGDTVLQYKTHYNINESTANVENLDYDKAMQQWTQDTIIEWPFVNPTFDRAVVAGGTDQVLKIAEVYGGFDKALTSPWLQLEPLNPEFIMSFEHSYHLSDNGQIAQVQYSFDDENWFSMDTSLNNPAEFFGNNLNHPALRLESLNIADFAGNTNFKVRFRINAFTDYTPQPAEWIIDNLALSGITNQPFMAVSEQASNDLIYQDGFE